MNSEIDAFAIWFLRNQFFLLKYFVAKQQAAFLLSNKINLNVILMK